MVKIGDRLRAFREKQIEFGEKSRERAISREGQKLRLQQVRTERRLSEAKERTAITMVKQKEAVTRGKARASSIFSGLSSVRPSPTARQDFFGVGSMGGGSLDSDPLGIRQTRPTAPRQTIKPIRRTGRRAGS